MKLESKIGKIKENDETIYSFLTNFNNFENLIPKDKVKNWKSDENSCRFIVDPIGEIGIKILEKTPFNRIKLTGIEDIKYNFYFWVQLKQIESKDTRIKLTMEAELNPMIGMMAKKPLQLFLDTLVEKLENYSFS